MTPSEHFAYLLHRSLLPQELKDAIIARLPSLPYAKLEELYAALQEEDARAQKILLQAEVG